MPTEIKDSKQFGKIVSGENLSVVHFSAKWADQCSHIDGVLDELAKQNELIKTDVKFCTCEAEDLSEMSLKYKIEAAPTILLFRNGKVIDRIDGADAAQLTAKIKQHNGIAPPKTTSKVTLEERLKALVKRHKIMLFMKGNREQPRCGFSKQIIQILNDTNVEYDTFDILQDEEVRQGLKTFSDWPTYPQLYVNGDLIGGLDIVKEMILAGEFESTLKG